MWLLYAFLSAITAALVAIFGKLGLEKVDTTLATAVRAVVMAGLLVITALVLKKFDGFSVHAWTNKQWLYIILAGIAGALSWLFYFSALKLGLASRVAAIDRLSVVFVFIFAALFLGEPLKLKSSLGALLIAIGAIIIVV